MVPPDSFSTAAPQSSSAFWSGCEAGTQCEIFRSKVFSCASVGVALKASNSAKKLFLIVHRLPRGLLVQTDFRRPLQTLLYVIIINARLRQTQAGSAIKPIISGGASIADKSSNHRRRTGRIAARAIAPRLRHRQHYPGTPCARIRARTH